MLAVALQRREIFFENTGAFQEALRDFQEIKQLKGFISPQLYGHTLSMAGMAKAHLAQTGSPQATALSYLDAAEKRIAEQPATNDLLFFAMFDKERYLLNRAMTLVASPDTKLHLPEKAQECLRYAERERKASGKVNVLRQIVPGS